MDALTNLVLEVFRLNGALLTSGDALVEDLGLTSARWQVMGAVALSPAPLPVASLARNIGVTRQAVRRVADDLERAGLIEYAPNPHHQRAKLVLLSPAGEVAYGEALSRWSDWGKSIATGLSSADLEKTVVLLREVRRRIDTGAVQTSTSGRRRSPTSQTNKEIS